MNRHGGHDPDRPDDDPLGSMRGDSSSGTEWWRYDAAGAQEEMKESLRDDRQDLQDAAREVGMTVGEAIAARMPDPHAWADRIGLDIRWMRLWLHVPAILIAVLVQWGGRSLASRMLTTIAENGVFAPLGWLLFFALLFGIVMIIPGVGVLGRALASLTATIVRGAWGLLVATWHTKYGGYLMRLVVAIFAWSFIIGVLVYFGRALIHWLTGV